MKLEIGKFIRTKPSGLILEITEDIIGGIKSYIGEEKYQVYDNIIDLIEVGDYVNGKEVTCVTGNNYIELDYGCNMVGCNNEDIKTILTKEQFENNCYKIGD